MTADLGSNYFIREARERYGVLGDRDEYTAGNIFWTPKEARRKSPADWPRSK